VLGELGVLGRPKERAGKQAKAAKAAKGRVVLMSRGVFYGGRNGRPPGQILLILWIIGTGHTLAIEFSPCSI
jgi:hypothetical protein